MEVSAPKSVLSMQKLEWRRRSRFRPELPTAGGAAPEDREIGGKIEEVPGVLCASCRGEACAAVATSAKVRSLQSV